MPRDRENAQFNHAISHLLKMLCAHGVACTQSSVPPARSEQDLGDLSKPLPPVSWTTRGSTLGWIHQAFLQRLLMKTTKGTLSDHCGCFNDYYVTVHTHIKLIIVDLNGIHNDVGNILLVEWGL